MKSIGNLLARCFWSAIFHVLTLAWWLLSVCGGCATAEPGPALSARASEMRRYHESTGRQLYKALTDNVECMSVDAPNWCVDIRNRLEESNRQVEDDNREYKQAVADYEARSNAAAQANHDTAVGILTGIAVLGAALAPPPTPVVQCTSVQIGNYVQTTCR